MNKRLMIWTLVTLGIVSVMVYRLSLAQTPQESPLEGQARRMWSETGEPPAMGKPSGGEHELKALEISLKDNPDHVPILLRMAQVARDLGKTEDTLRHLREAVRLDPGNLEAKLELGRALYDTGDVTGATRETEALLEIDPANLDGLYNLGAIYGNLGQDDKARKYWRKAVAISPDSESGRRSRDALKQIGDSR